MMSGLNSCSGEPAARGHGRARGEDAGPFVSIPVLVNLRLGDRVAVRGDLNAAAAVSIPVLVNLRLGAELWPSLPRLPASVSIPVLVNLRLGVVRCARGPDMLKRSQFLFW